MSVSRSSFDARMHVFYMLGRALSEIAISRKTLTRSVRPRTPKCGMAFSTTPANSWTPQFESGKTKGHFWVISAPKLPVRQRPLLALSSRTGTDWERRQSIGYGPFAKPSRNTPSLRTRAVNSVGFQ